MNLVRLVETYSKDNQYLMQYMLERPLSTYDHWHMLEDESEFQQAAELAGVDFSALSDDDKLDACYLIDEILQARPDWKDELGYKLVEVDPMEAPTWAFFTLEKKQLLPPPTPLVHWSNSTRQIYKRGFQFGCEDIQRLGLTTYRRRRTVCPGYNFAFLADSGEAENSERKYGDSAVLFRSSGVQAYHSGDEETQVIFWGPSITEIVGYLEDEHNDYLGEDRIKLTTRRGEARFSSIDQAVVAAFR